MAAANQPQTLRIPEIPAEIVIVRSARKTVSATLTDGGSVLVAAPLFCAVRIAASESMFCLAQAE